VALPHEEMGAGPAVVLLHAGVADRTMWAEHLPWLAQSGFRALAVDLPGFGEAPLEGAVAPWTEVLMTMDELEIERAALVGVSFGGAVAQRVAVLAPERVVALGLISSPAREVEPSEALLAVWEAEEEALGRGDIEGAVQAVVEGWTQPDAPPALRERVAEMQRRTFLAQEQGEQPPEAQDPLELQGFGLGRIACPVLIAAGERDMGDFHEAAEALAAELPQAGHAVILGAGHLAPLETPEAFRALVSALLASAPERPASA